MKYNDPILSDDPYVFPRYLDNADVWFESTLVLFAQ